LPPSGLIRPVAPQQQVRGYTSTDFWNLSSFFLFID
jgi:hypothetical protein